MSGKYINTHKDEISVDGGIKPYHPIYDGTVDDGVDTLKEACYRDAGNIVCRNMITPVTIFSEYHHPFQREEYCICHQRVHDIEPTLYDEQMCVCV